MRLNDRADETRYIDPVTEQERSSRFWLRQIGGHNAWRDSNGQLRTTSAQAIWMGVDHNVHTEANGSRIENDANNNIQTRLGFHTFIRTQEKNSGPHGDDFEPFVEMNGIHNSKDFAVSINGVKVEQAGARNLGEIKHGVNGNLNPAPRSLVRKQTDPPVKQIFSSSFLISFYPELHHPYRQSRHL